MKILMIAPEPFFQPRGTPISVFFRNQALTSQGHSVDLITYPLGEDVVMPGLKIHRVPNILFLKKIKIGPSFAKIPLDALLLVKAASALLRKKYDLIFTHEEGSFIGVLLAAFRRLPHVYDMHSSLPQQLENFAFTRSPILKGLFSYLESLVLKRAQAVIVICPDLENLVKSLGYGEKTVLIENVLDFPCEGFSAGDIENLRREAAPNGEKIVLYAGNFGPYQGIPLLLDAAARVREPAVFVLVGGSGPDRTAMEKKARELGLGRRAVFFDRVPPDRVPLFVAAADVLVSPRDSGTNTPLKIYSFLKSGKPLVATRLWTHTQVLDDRIAVLADPTPEAFAEGLNFALSNPEAAERARAALALAEKDYTFEAYKSRLERVLSLAVSPRRT
jgi:glycosyltransferase involved in cell wall biosynthesis